MSRFLQHDGKSLTKMLMELHNASIKEGSISDVVATLDCAKAAGDVGMILLLDERSASGGLFSCGHRQAQTACLGLLDPEECLIGFISAILSGEPCGYVIDS
ncbi:hypothetical protein MTO96_043260, partial [Rhipicephalus appendiculatus]